MEEASSSREQGELLEETSSPMAPTCPQGQGSSHWTGLVLLCSAPSLPPPETCASVSFLGSNLSAGTTTVTDTGQWCYLWVELAAVLCAIGLGIDDFLAMLWCQEMHAGYRNPKCRELLGCFCQRVEEKEDRQGVIWGVFFTFLKGVATSLAIEVTFKLEETLLKDFVHVLAIRWISEGVHRRDNAKAAALGQM